MSKRRRYEISAQLSSRDVEKIADVTGNIYESLSVISTRSRIISNEMKHELTGKLEEFASTTDTLEEIHENKEQIEISKFYERMPHATLLAYEEFMKERLEHREPTEEELIAIKAKKQLSRRAGKRRR